MNNGSIREGSQASSLSYSTGILGRILGAQGNAARPRGFALIVLIIQSLVIAAAVFSAFFLKQNLDKDTKFLISSKKVFEHMTNLDRDLRKIVSAVQRIAIVEAKAKALGPGPNYTYSTSYLSFLSYTRIRASQPVTQLDVWSQTM